MWSEVEENSDFIGSIEIGDVSNRVLDFLVGKSYPSHDKGGQPQQKLVLDV